MSPLANKIYKQLKMTGGTSASDLSISMQTPPDVMLAAIRELQKSGKLIYSGTLNVYYVPNHLSPPNE